MNVEKLLEKAIVGTLDSTEKSFLAKKSENPNEGELYKILHALGEAQAIEYRPLVESFLTFTSDNAIPAIALQVLGLYWGFSEDYLSVTKRFIRGMYWDYDDDAKLSAIHVARGYLGNNNMDVELVEILLELIEDPFEEDGIRKSAYITIATMVGKSRDELPGIFEKFDFDRDVDNDVIKLARNILRKKTN